MKNTDTFRRRAAAACAGLAAALFLCAPCAQAGPFPAFLNYQGKLSNPSGNPLTGVYSFRFRLYDSPTKTTLLATDANYTGANAVNVVNGLYSVQIGSLTAGGLPEAVFHQNEVWLEITVGAGAANDGPEILDPPERLAASAFAFRAINAEKLGIGVNIATFTSSGNLQLVSGSTITSNGTLSFSTAPSAALTTTPNLFIGSNGNVGVGTATPGTSLEVAGGLRINTTTAKPTCDSTQRGTAWLQQGGGGVADLMFFCMKKSDESYQWVQLGVGN